MSKMLGTEFGLIKERNFRIELGFMFLNTGGHLVQILNGIKLQLWLTVNFNC